MSVDAQSDEKPDAAPRFFIVRIMKTGTTTLLDHARNTFGSRRDVYPTGGIDTTPGEIDSASSLPHLLALPAARREEIRVYLGHFPYIAYQMLGIECVTATILRDPVARIASYVRQAKGQPRFREHSFEAIYEDPFVFGMFLHNHQAKNFAMKSTDPLTGMMDIIEIDDDRLRLAEANLEQVDVVGLTEHYGEFLDEMRFRFGWTIQPGIATNVSTENWEPSPALRRRIQADNLADIEFYEYARALVSRRRRAHPPLSD